MMGLEKGISEGKDVAAPVQAIIRGDEEQRPLIPVDPHVQPTEGSVVARFAAKMNTVLKKRQLHLCWLLLVASVILLRNHSFNHAVPDINLVTPALIKFSVLLCAICLMVRTMKRMV